MCTHIYSLVALSIVQCFSTFQFFLFFIFLLLFFSMVRKKVVESLISGMNGIKAKENSIIFSLMRSLFLIIKNMVQ